MLEQIWRPLVGQSVSPGFFLGCRTSEGSTKKFWFFSIAGLFRPFDLLSQFWGTGKSLLWSSDGTRKLELSRVFRQNLFLNWGFFWVWYCTFPRTFRAHNNFFRRKFLPTLFYSSKMSFWSICVYLAIHHSNGQWTRRKMGTRPPWTAKVAVNKTVQTSKLRGRDLFDWQTDREPFVDSRNIDNDFYLFCKKWMRDIIFAKRIKMEKNTIYSNIAYKWVV